MDSLSSAPQMTTERAEDHKGTSGDLVNNSMEAHARQEQLRELPDFSYRTLICLEDFVSNSDRITPDNLPKAKKLRKRLFDQLSQEGRMFPKLAKALEHLDFQLDLGTSRGVLGQVREIAMQLFPFKVPLFKQYALLAKHNAEAVKGKEIILLLGNTGSGKSTLFHYLHGTPLERITEHSISYIGTKAQLEGPAAQVKISPFTRSETTNITAAPLDLSQVRKRGASLYLCDSPGLFDTRGAELDIAQSIGITHALKHCKTLRVVFLISFQSIGDRFQGLRDSVKVLATLFPRIEESLGAFTYLFTKFPDDYFSTFVETVRDLRETMSAADQTLVEILEDLVEKATPEHVVDPLDLTKRISLLKSISKAPPIKDPQDAIRVFLTDNSEQIIRRCITTTRTLIENALRRDQHEVTLYALQEFHTLAELIDIGEVSQAHNEFTLKVSRWYTEFFQAANEEFKIYFTPEIPFSQEATEKMAGKLEQLRQADKLLSRVNHDHSSLCEALMQSVLKVQRELESLIDSTEMASATLLIYLANLKTLKLVISSGDDSHDEAVRKLQGRIRDHLEQSQQLLMNGNYSGFVEQYDTFKGMQELMHTTDIDFGLVTENFKRIFEDSLKAAVKRITAAFEKTTVTEDDVQELIANFDHLTRASTVVGFPDTLAEIAKDNEGRCYQTVETMLNQVKYRDLTDGGNPAKAIYKLQMLERVEAVRSNCLVCKDKILTWSKSQCEQLHQGVSQLTRIGPLADERQLAQKLRQFEEMSWIAEVQHDFFESIKQKISASLLTHFKAMTRKLQYEPISLNSCERIPEIVHLIDKVSNLECMTHRFETVAEECAKFKHTIKTNIERVFQEIRESASAMRSYTDVEIWSKFLCGFIACELTREKADRTHDFVDLQIVKYRETLLAELQRSFAHIVNSGSYSDELAIQAIRKQAADFAKRFNELYQITKTASPAWAGVFHLRDLEEWATKLEGATNLLTTILTGFKERQQLKLLKESLQIIELLGSLECPEWDASQCNKDAKCFRDYIDRKFLIELQEAVKYNAYREVSKILGSGILPPHQLKSAHKTVTNSMSERIEDINKSIKHLFKSTNPCHDAKPIVKKLKEFEEHTTLLGTLPERLRQKYECGFQNACTQLEELIFKLLKTIEEANLQDSKTLLTQRRHAKKLLQVFGRLLGPDAESRVEERFAQTKGIFEWIGDRAIDEYSQTDLREFAFNPPSEMYERLKSSDQQMRPYLKRFSLSLVKKFEGTVQEAKTMEASATKRVSHLRECQRSIEYMPAPIQSVLEDICSLGLQEVAPDFLRAPEQSLRKADLEFIFTTLQKAEEKGCTEEFEVLQGCIVAYVEHRIEKIEQSRSIGFDEALREIYIFTDEVIPYIWTIKGLAPVIKTRSRTICAVITMLLEELRQVHEHSNLPRSKQCITTLKHIGRIWNDSTYSFILTEEVKTSFKEACDALAQCFKTIAEEFRHSLSTRSAEMINSKLRFMSNWSEAHAEICRISSQLPTCEWALALQRILQNTLSVEQMNEEAKTI